MSLYAVKNDKGEWWDFYDDDNFWDASECRQLIADGKEEAYVAANKHGGRVVELVEAPAKVVVSAEEAEMLERAKNMLNPMHLLWMDELTHNGDSNGQNRLMRAYVNGWQVEKPKRWNVKVPHTKEAWYYQYGDTDLLTICPADKKLRGEFTAAEIEHYGLQDCERVEVSDDEQ